MEKTHKKSAKVLLRLNFIPTGSVYTSNTCFVERPAETQTNIRLASHLVRTPYSYSEGREFESPLCVDMNPVI
jgi:hypothetical protein